MPLATPTALALVLLRPPSMGMDWFFLGFSKVRFPLATLGFHLAPLHNNNLFCLGYPSATTDPLELSGVRIIQHRQELRISATPRMPKANILAAPTELMLRNKG